MVGAIEPLVAARWFSGSLLLIDGSFVLPRATPRQQRLAGMGVHLATSGLFGVGYWLGCSLSGVDPRSPWVAFLYAGFLWLCMLFVALPVARQGVAGRNIGSRVWLEQFIAHAVFGAVMFVVVLYATS